MDNIMSNINSIYSNNSTYTNATTSSISSKLNSTDLSKATDDELMDVCKDFESYFVEQMMKAMVKMSSVEEGDSDNIYASLFGVTQMAAKVTDTQGKGLGIAQTLYKQMKRNYSVKEV